MEIKIQETLIVSQKEEKHYKIMINDKEIFVSKWFSNDEFGIDGGIEIFKGEELLTEEEKEEVLNYMEEQ